MWLQFWEEVYGMFKLGEFMRIFEQYVFAKVDEIVGN